MIVEELLRVKSGDRAFLRELVAALPEPLAVLPANVLLQTMMGHTETMLARMEA